MTAKKGAAKKAAPRKKATAKAAPAKVDPLYGEDGDAGQPEDPSVQPVAKIEGYKYNENPEEDPNYHVEENDTGQVTISFSVPRRFADWVERRAPMEGMTPQKFLEKCVREAWAKDPLRRTSASSTPRSQFSRWKDEFGPE